MPWSMDPERVLANDKSELGGFLKYCFMLFVFIGAVAFLYVDIGRFASIRPPVSTIDPVPFLFLTAIVSFASLLAVYFYSRKVGMDRLKARLKWIVICFASNLILYVVLSTILIRNIPSVQDRIVTGFIEKPEVHQLLSTRTIDQIIEMDPDPYHIWKSWTVDVAEILLTLLWLSMLSSAFLILGIVVESNLRPIKQKKATTTEPQPRKKGATNE